MREICALGISRAISAIKKCEEDGTAPRSFCQGCFTFSAKKFTSTRKSGTNESETNDVDKLNEEIEKAKSDFESKTLSQSIESQNTTKNNDESILKDSIEESKKNEEEINVTGVVDELAGETNMIEEAAKLDKIAELEASKQADLEKKMASSTDKNNLPRGKDFLSVIAAQAAKKKIGNDLLGN